MPNPEFAVDRLNRSLFLLLLKSDAVCNTSIFQSPDKLKPVLLIHDLSGEISK
jgi:hypothetical protein